MRVGDRIIALNGEHLDAVGGHDEIASHVLSSTIAAAISIGAPLDVVVEQIKVLSEDELRDARICTNGVAVVRKKGKKMPVHRWVVCMHPPYPDEEEHCPHGAIVLYDIKNCAAHVSEEGAHVPYDDAFSKIDKGTNCSDMWRFSKIDAAALHLQVSASRLPLHFMRILRSHLTRSP